MSLIRAFIGVILESDIDARRLERMNARIKSGPVFSVEVIEFIRSLSNDDLAGLDYRKSFVKWLANELTSLPVLPPMHVVHSVRDFVISMNIGDAIKEYAWNDILQEVAYWLAECENEPDENIDPGFDTVVYDFNDGYKIVELSNDDLTDEGNAMGHCVAIRSIGGNVKIFSLRDKNNKPHATIEIHGDQVKEIVGKQNVAPIKKYQHRIDVWLNAVGFTHAPWFVSPF